jgi:hypothetical protein
MRKLFLAGYLAVGVAGCSPPPLQFVPANVSISQRKVDAALISTVVTVAPKAEAKGKVDIAGSEADVTELWKSALDDTLLRTAIFRDSSPRRVTLTVKILKLSKTGVLGFGVESAATYQLIDRNTGQIVYSKEIDSLGHASDYVGVDRVRKAVSRSVQDNITAFVQQVETADLMQPPSAIK